MKKAKMLNHYKMLMAEAQLAALTDTRESTNITKKAEGILDKIEALD